MRFIRKGGRVIPIRDGSAQTSRRRIGGAALIGTGVASGVAGAASVVRSTNTMGALLQRGASAAQNFGRKSASYQMAIRQLKPTAAVAMKSWKLGVAGLLAAPVAIGAGAALMKTSTKRKSK